MSDLAALIPERYALDRGNIDEWADAAEREHRPGSKAEAAWLIREHWRARTRILTMMLGRRFGRLVVINLCSNGNWWCRCDCENAVEVEEDHFFQHSRMACGQCGPSQDPPPWKP